MGWPWQDGCCWNQLEGSWGLLVLLFPQFSGASRLREAVWTMAPAGVRNLFWHKGLCKVLQDTPGFAIMPLPKVPSFLLPSSCTSKRTCLAARPADGGGRRDWGSAQPCPVPALLCAIVCSSLLLLPEEGKAFSQPVAIDIES